MLALTGCDTPSRFAGKSKHTCWKVFLREPGQLKQIREAPNFSEDAIIVAEKLVCLLCGCGCLNSINDSRLLRSSLTQDALLFHLQRW